VRSFSDPETEFRIVASETSVDVDGYKLGEPKFLECPYCAACVQITPDPSDPGIEELPHATACPQRDVKSEWWWQQFGR
jgi:hypothetical protein